MRRRYPREKGTTLNEAIRRDQKYNPPYRLNVEKHRTINSAALYHPMAIKHATAVCSASALGAARSKRGALLPVRSPLDIGACSLLWSIGGKAGRKIGYRWDMEASK